MSDFAYVSEFNTVKTVIVANQSFIDSNGNQVVIDQHLETGIWIEVDATIVGIGDTYDPETQTFTRPSIE